MKLQGKWNVSLYDLKEKFWMFIACTDVEIFEGGPWLAFTSADGERHLTDFPAKLWTGAAAQWGEN